MREVLKKHYHDFKRENCKKSVKLRCECATFPLKKIIKIFKMVEWHINHQIKIHLGTRAEIKPCLHEEQTRRNREVVDFTRSRVKSNSKLANLMKLTRIEGHNGNSRTYPRNQKSLDLD